MHPNNLASVPLTARPGAARRRRTVATCLQWTLALLTLGCLSFGLGLAVRGDAPAAATPAAATAAVAEASSGAIQWPREYSTDGVHAADEVATPLAPESSGREEEQKLEVPSPSSEAEASGEDADAAAASDVDGGVGAVASEADATAAEQGEVDWAPLIAKSLVGPGRYCPPRHRHAF